MTNDEIQAHLAQLRKALQSQTTGLHAVSCDAIETLLAREADERAAFDRAYLASKSESASNSILALYKDCKAILDPQPAALAEEKNNAD